MGYRYAVIGAGRQGVSSSYDIGRFGDAEEIILYDVNSQAAASGAERLNSLLKTKLVKGCPLDAGNKNDLRQALKGVHSTISAVPYRLNLSITQAAIESGSNYCDLGGNTDLVREQLKTHDAAKQAGVTVTPDCGMAPGLNISLGVYALSFVKEPEELLIWDGGLPQNPTPPWNYHLTFNMNGLTNEYFDPAFFLRDGQIARIPCLTEIEELEFPAPLGKLEAAVTTGGLSTACWTFAGKLQRLENKTLRYPGHWKEFEAFQRLGLFELEPVDLDGRKVVPRDMFHALLEPKIATGEVRDIAVIRVQCKGIGYPNSCTLELIETYDSETGFTAMEKLTGWHASIIAILAAKGKLPKGAVPVENALLGKTLVEEVNRRGWKIRNTTVAET